METHQAEQLGVSKEGPTWEELIGSNNWEGLLDPLNDELRRLLLRCGDFCQVTYDSFISDANSAYIGGCRFTKKDLLEKTVFPEGHERYDVVGYLYATSSVGGRKETNWMGYIALTKDEASKERREIYVAWRGTIRDYEWINVLGVQPVPAKPLLRPGTNNEVGRGEPRVMSGWLKIYNTDNQNSPFSKSSARTQLLNILQELIQRYKHESLSITIAGHSLGATLATISALDVAENLTFDTKIPVTAFVFGSPRVGNSSFRNRLISHSNLRLLHVRNAIDLIPLYPLRIMGYRDVGIELEIFHGKSPYLKRSMTTGDWHNLQGMLHVVNGWQGMDNEFKVVVETRSLALVNKSCDFLLEELGVPGSWWVERNKGMALDENRKWIMPRPEGFGEGVRDFVSFQLFS